MPELDRLKEQVAYLKFWLGIVVVTDISVAGWLISASDSAAPFTVFLAVAGVVLLSVGIVVLHRQIERRLEHIGRLQPWKLLLLSSCLASFSSLSALPLTRRAAPNSAF